MATKTNEQILENTDPILCNIQSLQNLLGCGQFTARKIAAAAHAEIKIGRRSLYNTEKIKQYINKMSLTEADEV